MINYEAKVTFMVAEDDNDDFLVIDISLKKIGIEYNLVRVTDGEMLLKSLRVQQICPVVVLLDLNMPKMDGRQALKEIKSDPVLKRIPVLVFTTSKSSDDIQRCYDLGANAYFIKPANFDQFKEMILTLGKHWFHAVTLPPM